MRQPGTPAPRPQGPRSPEGPAVVDERDHVLHVAVRVLPLPQVLLLVQLRLLSVPGGHTATSEQPRGTAPTRRSHSASLASGQTSLQK